MGVVTGVATGAGRLHPLVLLCLMARLAGRDLMQADQRIIGKAMIEPDIVAPSDAVMTLSAIRTELAEVNILGLWQSMQAIEILALMSLPWQSEHSALACAPVRANRVCLPWSNLAVFQLSMLWQSLQEGPNLPACTSWMAWQSLQPEGRFLYTSPT